MVTALEIAQFLGLELVGPDRNITRMGVPDNAPSGSLLWLKKFTDEYLDLVNATSDSMAIAGPDYQGKLTGTHVIAKNPKASFALAANKYFYFWEPGKIEDTARIGRTAKLGTGVSVGHYTIIDDDVEIGNGTEIRDHVVIRRGTRIGAHCLIKSNCTIGEEGFGYAFDDDEHPIRFPHAGRVVIGNHCEVGANTSIARGALTDTILSDYAKIDDVVLVAHNAFVGENSLVCGGATLCGSSKVGRNAFVGAHSTIINGGTVGDYTLVGLGAIVIRPAPSRAIMGGAMATHLRDRRDDETF